MSNVDRIEECRISSCITLNSVPTLLKRVAQVRRKVCHPMGFSIPWFFAAGRMYLRTIACPQHGFRPRYRLLGKTQSSDFLLAERSRHCAKVSLANCYFAHDSSGFLVLATHSARCNLLVLFIHFIACG